MAQDVNPGLPHDLDGFWADITRLGPRAEDFVFRPAVVPEQAFRHLAARRVSGAKDQNALSLIHARSAVSADAAQSLNVGPGRPKLRVEVMV